ncbi:MAG: NlpC/P60 family protein [Bacilli bacterium]
MESKILKSLLFISLLFVFFSCNKVYAASNKCEGQRTLNDVRSSNVAYVSRDSILRIRYSTSYSSDSLKHDGINVALPKGTAVEITGYPNEDYYKVTVLCDGYFFLRNYEGYVIKSSVEKTNKPIPHDSDRTLSVADKTAVIKNAYNMYKGGKKVAFVYPSKGSDGKLKNRSAGYNLVLTNKKPNNISIKNGKKQYPIDCSGFVSTVLETTFYINMQTSKKRVYSTWDFIKQSSETSEYIPSSNSSKDTSKKFYIVDKVKKGGDRKTLDVSKIQIGDMIVGEKPEISNPNHIMLYIGDGLIMHSTASVKPTGIHINYLKRVKNGVDNYYIQLGSNRRFTKDISIIRIKKDLPKGRRRIYINDNGTDYTRKKLKKVNA